MAKFFTYKTLNDLREDAKRRKIDIDFEEQLDRIRSPVKIYGRTLGNALATHPMEGCDGTLDGRPDELTFRRYVRFARGGAKLIWGEATAVTEDGRANTRQLFLNDRTYDAFALMVEETRRNHRERFGDDADLLFGLQLTHSGRWSHHRPIIAVRNPVIDPVTFIDKVKKTPLPDVYPVITDDDLKRLEDAFAQGAKLAWKAGFDFIDLKQCHTYLLNELLGAKTRPGMYGGSWENRTRFIRNVVDKIHAIAPGLHVASRINIYDGIPWISEDKNGKPRPSTHSPENGFGISADNPLEIDFTEPRQLIEMLRERGVLLFNLSLGSPYFNAHIGRPFEKSPPDMYPPPEHPIIGVARHFAATAKIKTAIPGITVVGTGYSWLRQFFPFAAEANMRKGWVDIVGLGRGAIAYPNFAIDLIEKGHLDKKQVCLAVSFCTTLMRRKDNDLGQFPSGCVPRDPLYAKIYNELPD